MRMSLFIQIKALIATLLNLRIKNETNANFGGKGWFIFPAKLYDSIIDHVLHNQSEHEKGLIGKKNIQELHEFLTVAFSLPLNPNIYFRCSLSSFIQLSW